MRLFVLLALTFLAGCGSRRDGNGSSYANGQDPVTLFQAGKTREAKMAAQAVVDLVEKKQTVNPEDAAKAYLGLGLIVSGEGREYNSIYLFQKATELYSKAGKAMEAAHAKSLHGRSLLRTGKITEATAVLQDSVNCFTRENLQFSYECLRAQSDLAMVAIRERKFTDARAILKMILGMCLSDAKFPPLFHVEILTKMGDADFQAGDYPSALRHYLAAQKVAETSKGVDQATKAAIRTNVKVTNSMQALFGVPR